MEILIDLYKIKKLYSGLGQFSKHFGQELALRKKNEFVPYFLIPPNTQTDFIGQGIRYKKTSFLKRYFPATNKTYAIWHSLHQLPSFRPNQKTTWILTIHDLNFLIEKNEKKREKYLSKLQKNVDKADYITTISKFTKKEIEKHLDLKQKKVEVIYNGVSLGEGIKKIKPLFMGKDKYFFSIGIFHKKKNFEVLLPLMTHFPEYKLVIAGDKDTPYGKEIEKAIFAMNLQDRVILPGKINPENKQWLYANCTAFLFPSLAEGFGLPVIEAMAEGKPVFLSPSTSLPEIGGKIAFYFDPLFNPEKMAHLIRSKMDYVARHNLSFEVASKKHSHQFSWKNCLNNYLNLYRKIKLAQN